MTALKIFFSLYLLVLAAADIRKRELSGWSIAAGAIFVPVALLINPEYSVWDCLLGIIPGVIFIITSVVTKGQIGMADAVLLVIIGLVKGLSGCIVILSAALVLVAVFSGILLVLGRANRKTSVPFIPFLFLGDLFLIFLCQ